MSRLEPTLRDRCPNCGKQYRARSCGITHGMIRARTGDLLNAIQ